MPREEAGALRSKSIVEAEMDPIDEDFADDGVSIEPCDDEPLFARLAAEKLKLAARSKLELDAVIVDAIEAGWQVVIRSHCSETGRHEAKLLRPL